jgi:signal transduction histidine kinase
VETAKNSQVKYQYMLDGYDKDWSSPDNKTSAVFGNIYEGNYTFKLKAQNADGVWSEPLSYSFKVLPPWWRTWWMYLMYAVLTVTVGTLFFLWNNRRIIHQKKILETKIAVATKQIIREKEIVEAQNKKIATTLTELQSAQAQLIQSEKMASLGELTAGIAHEIQNPLNFVNNFSEVSNEMIDEMKEELATGNLQLVTEIANDIKQNLEKINHHGKRADAIVKGMLQHSRRSEGVKEPTDINALCDEYLRLSYHGLSAKDKNFNAEIKTDFDKTISNINIIPQDIGRVLLNLYNNAFYATNEKFTTHHSPLTDYKPLVSVQTKKINDKVEIIVEDNGNGIPQTIVDKIFQPFFTTKPTGEGTGLGLSLSYDIIKAHGGAIKVETRVEEGTTFIIQLPIV